MRKLQKTDWLILLVLTVVAGLLRFINLPHPHEIIFDETYFANFANNYLTDTKFFDAEPPLAKFLIAIGIKIFGFTSFGWRVVPALFGMLVIPLFYILAKRLFGGRLIPTLAGVLALLDGLLLVESRTAVVDGFVVFFNLLTYICLLMSLQAETRQKSLKWLAFTGVALGLGLSVKWITAAFLAPAIALLVVLVFGHRGWLGRILNLRSTKPLWDALGGLRRNIHHPLAYVTFLGIVPAAIYCALFAIHVPFDSTGESIWGIHKQIFNYHHHLTATHPYGSTWTTWPLMIRPVAYYFNATGGWSAIVAMGNPIIWWGGILSTIYLVAKADWRLLAAGGGLASLAVLLPHATVSSPGNLAAIGVMVVIGLAALQFLRRKEVALALILFALVAHFGPWSIIGRVLFIYHYLGGYPFVILGLAYVLSRSWYWKPKDSSVQVFTWTLLVIVSALLGGLLERSISSSSPRVSTFAIGALVVGGAMLTFALTDVRKLRWGQKQVIGFVALAALAFIFFYPVWTGLPLDSADYYRHMWLRSWI